jgi:hypothetical protein
MPSVIVLFIQTGEERFRHKRSLQRLATMLQPFGAHIAETNQGRPFRHEDGSYEVQLTVMGVEMFVTGKINECGYQVVDRKEIE